MVKLTDSLKEFLLQSKHGEIIPLLMFGHVELFTDEIKKEYAEWLSKKTGRSKRMNLEERITKTVMEKLNDGTVEQIVKVSVETAIKKSLDDLFSWSGAGKK